MGLEEVKDPDERFDLEQRITEMKYELKEINNNIESLEEKQEFITIKLSEISVELNKIQPDSLDTMNLDDFRSLEGFRICLGTFFQIVFSAQMNSREL